MARDQALLDLAERDGVGFVRLYCWAPWCLSLGRHEPALRRYDREAVARLGLAVVRRPTGGRAVWHARELTYAVAAPAGWFGSLAESYRAIHLRLARGLRTLGIAAELAPAGAALSPGAGACFAAAAGGEVLAAGRKLVGSAQLRQGSAFLQHGSLLLEDDQSLVCELSRGAAPSGGETTLAALLGHPVPFAEAAALVARALAPTGAAWLEPPTAELDRLAAQHLRRFADPSWTWRR